MRVQILVILIATINMNQYCFAGWLEDGRKWLEDRTGSVHITKPLEQARDEITGKAASDRTAEARSQRNRERAKNTLLEQKTTLIAEKGKVESKLVKVTTIITNTENGVQLAKDDLGVFQVIEQNISSLKEKSNSLYANNETTREIVKIVKDSEDSDLISIEEFISKIDETLIRIRNERESMSDSYIRKIFYYFNDESDIELAMLSRISEDMKNLVHSESVLEKYRDEASLIVLDLTNTESTWQGLIKSITSIENELHTLKIKKETLIQSGSDQITQLNENKKALEQAVEKYASAIDEIDKQIQSI